MIKSLIYKVLKKYDRQIVRVPRMNDALPSFIVPASEWTSKPTARLIDISVEALQHARTVSHADIANKMEEFPHWPEIWPGEHYKLLTGLVQALKPKLIIEIGTATGYSALAMKKTLPADAKIVTFDIVSWKEFPKCILREPDFKDGRLEQIVADLTDKSIFDQYASLLKKADFIFIDAAKDGVQEQRFIDHFNTLSFETKPVFMFDDIRFVNMIEIWHGVNKPKLDLTSFGHWSGTGLVDWTASV